MLNMGLIMSISGFNGTQNILSSMAKLRVEQGIITKAKIIGDKGQYKIHFTNPEAQWNEQDLVLSSTRDPYEPKYFKSLDGAIADLKRIGLKKAEVVVTLEM